MTAQKEAMQAAVKALGEIVAWHNLKNQASYFHLMENATEVAKQLRAALDEPTQTDDELSEQLCEKVWQIGNRLTEYDKKKPQILEAVREAFAKIRASQPDAQAIRNAALEEAAIAANHYTGHPSKISLKNPRTENGGVK